jgi:catechol 2,3-dioxygenase-like lactoylglutathione lyase family enzyme
MTIHHLALTAADLPKAAAFYDAVFVDVLGYRRGHTSAELVTWIGPEPEPEILLYVVEGDDTTAHQHGQPGLQHIAFQVDSRATVDAVHTAVVDGGWTVVHSPREYPEYSPGYYATFLEDADGSRWEFTHTPPPTH